MLNANKIAQFCATQYNAPLCPTEGAVNIVYIEGMNPDGTENADRLDEWNDLRVLVGMVEGGWKILFSQIATTEPGRFYTQNPLNKKGAARIAFGYHPPAWAHGLHKGVQPALRQRKSVLIHRDLNRDGKRNPSEKPHKSGLIWLNQHGTKPGYKGGSIGMYSAACLVGMDYDMHITFLQMTKFDPRYLASENIGQEYLYDLWALPGDEFSKFKLPLV